MTVYQKICSKTILLTLLTVLLLACARGESYDVFEDEADIPSENEADAPSENKILKIDEEYQADHQRRVTPTPRIDFSHVASSVAPIASTQPMRVSPTSSDFFPVVQQTPTPQGFTRNPTTRRPWRRFTTRRPTSRPQSDCPFDCDKTCVVHRRSFFNRGYVCVLPIHRGCQLCCRSYARCRRSNVPDWICYQHALDCVCRYRTRYRYISCHGHGRCLAK